MGLGFDLPGRLGFLCPLWPLKSSKFKKQVVSAQIPEQKSNFFLMIYIHKVQVLPQCK